MRRLGSTLSWLSVKNATIRTLWPASIALRPPNGDLAVSGRPTVNYSLAVNYAINSWLDVDQRPDPDGPNKTVGYHLVNVFLHLGCGLLLLALIRRTLERGPFSDEWTRSAGRMATIVTALWLLHPIQTEAVDYVVQRTELIVSLCYVSTLYAWRRAGRCHTPRRAQVANSLGRHMRDRNGERGRDHRTSGRDLCTITAHICADPVAPTMEQT